MNGKSWTGTAVWREEGDPFPIRKAAGAAALLLDEKGGLLRAGPTFPKTLGVDVRFGWDEVEKIERMRYLGIPFLGEGVRFTLKEGPTGTGSRIFSFGGVMTKRTAEEIVAFGESKGVEVEREAKFKIVRP
jgi:hypothetical protein